MNPFLHNTLSKRIHVWLEHLCLTASAISNATLLFFAQYGICVQDHRDSYAGYCQAMVGIMSLDIFIFHILNNAQSVRIS
ncbi:hypothetical protein BDV37DRAFT_238634 [Aspergillus pseudonomiae]|uniref:Uncharacterized protein n=1 Tax=Aspergillus pseudonomiae TaxID=1506151 RepID=A0A5N7DQW1_9EURO|nr:uncharacterized protein BDV37DRAFT_238634 [Aspergillus pseudonomiae]KAE8408433.1 hypothetical protein BDV37DRAFT_238634 [Aspergillus pseudonomiae]